MTGEPQSPDILVGSGTIPVSNIWYLLLYAWNQAALLGRWRTLVESAPDLDSLLGSILSDIIRQRVRVGLGRAYQEQTELLDRIKGRIDFNETVKRLAMQSGRAVCRFQTLSSDVPKNQIVRTTLMRLAKAGKFGGDRSADRLRQELRLLGAALELISIIPLSSSLIRQQMLSHDENDYRVMLSICDMILRRQMPTEHTGARAMNALERNALTLSLVYESFVANFYRVHLKNWRVRAQVPLDWDASATSQYLPTMRADVVLENKSAGQITVIDTKFTAHSLQRSRFGKLRFASSHIYQMYSYLRSQESLSPEYAASSGILLYPTAGHHLSESVSLQGHAVRFETVDLSVPWNEIEKRLLSIMGVESAATS